MRKAIALFAALGLVGCFLPLDAGWFSFFDLRHFDALPVYLVVLGFLAPLVAGLADKTRIAAVVGAVGFGYILYKFGLDTTDLVIHGGVGAKLMGVGVIGGFACALLAFAERDRR